MLVDWFWSSLALSILLLWLVWHWAQQPPHLQMAPRSAALPKLLKPRTPAHCPACRLGSAPSIDHPPTCIPVTPWCERKSQRGAPKRIATQGFACPNRSCAYYQIVDAHIHALVGDGAHGQRERIQTLRCQACGTTFSTRRATPLYRLKTTSHRVAEVLTALAEGLSVAAAVRVFGHQHATITTWLTRAGAHSVTMHERVFRRLHLPHIQFDELRTRLRNRTHTLWLWLAIDPLTKIVPVLHHPEGTRCTDPGRRPCGGPRTAWAAGERLPPGFYERRPESVLLCIDRSFWRVGRRSGPTGASVADRGRPDLRTGEKDLSAPEVGAGHIRAALWNTRRTPISPARTGLEWKAQSGLCGAGEFDAAADGGGPHPSQLVDQAGSAAVAAASGVVASLLPFRATA